MRNGLLTCLLVLGFVLVACGDGGDSSATTTGATTSSTTTTSSSGGFGGSGGTGAQASSSGSGGNGGGQTQVPLEGFGDIAGSCGVLEAMDFNSSAPSIYSNNIDFKTLMFMANALSQGGKKIYDDGNLGGSSLLSEVFAYEVLYRCELAELLKTENEISYKDTAGKKTDLIVRMDGLSVGVSVTRAVGFPKEDPYTVAQAKDLLTGKLEGVTASTANVAAADTWTKQVLFIVAYAEQHATALKEAFNQIDAAIKGDTIVWVTVTDGDDAFLY